MGCYHSAHTDIASAASMNDHMTASKLEQGRESGVSSCAAYPLLDDGGASFCSTSSADSRPAVRPRTHSAESVRSNASAHASKPCKLRTDCRLRDAYSLRKTLGTGGFSVVRLAVERSTRREWACKIVDLPSHLGVGSCCADQQARDTIFREIEVVARLEHDSVIHLKEYFIEKDRVYIITELFQGGDLLDLVLARSLSESQARVCFRQLLEGLDYMHERGIMHRDIKLENLLIVSDNDLSRVKIADFGLAKDKAMEGFQSVCGTPEYVAPEVVLGNRYTTAVDVWSAGVVLYIMLSGFLPFHSDSRPLLFDQICSGHLPFHDPIWDGVSESAMDFICRLLMVDPSRRLTAAQALQHEWMTSPGGCSSASTSTSSNTAADSVEDTASSEGAACDVELVTMIVSQPRRGGPLKCQ